MARTLPPFVRPSMSTSWYHHVGDPDVPADESDMPARSPITMVDRIRRRPETRHHESGARPRRLRPVRRHGILAAVPPA